MDANARAIFERFRRFKAPNASNVARHRVIDDILRARLAARPETVVVLLGAGFDTRAYRLHGGRWFELDQPALIEAKEARLPASQAPNPLSRIPIDFARDSLADKLVPVRDAMPIVVVMEGVSMYLDPDALQSTARTLLEVLRPHTLVCDLMTRTFADRYGRGLRREIAALGGRFAKLVDDPAGLVTAVGYRIVDQRSIAGTAVELDTVRIPRWLLDTLLRSLRDGFRVCVFETVPRA